VLALSFFGGHVADRHSKHTIMVATQTAAMLLALILWRLVASGTVQVWHVFALATALGTVMAFDIPARQAFVVEMVGKEDLVNAIALNSSVFNAARMAGPALAGVIIASVGTARCFLINGLSYVAVICALLLMDKERLANSNSAVRVGFRRGAGQVWSFLREHEPALLVLLMTGTLSVFVLPYATLMPIFARDVLKVGPKGLGWLMSAAGVGALAGALGVAAFGKRGSRSRWLFGGAATVTIALLGFSLSPDYRLSLGLLFFLGMGVVVQSTTSNSYLQLSVPDEMRGRIMGLFGVVFLGMMPAGNLLAGFMAHIWGARAALGLGAAVCGTVTAIIFCSLGRRKG
jgi:MFS family permease